MRAYGFQSAKEAFAHCQPVPVGKWSGRLVFKSWGKSVNLHCFFEHADTLELHAISAFRVRGGGRRYTPKDGAIDFSEPGIEGGLYTLDVALNGKGNPAWLSAEVAQTE